MLFFLENIDYRIQLYILGFATYFTIKYLNQVFNAIHLGPFIDGPHKFKESETGYE